MAISGGFIFMFGFIAIGYVLMAVFAFMLAADVPEGEQFNAYQALFSNKKRSMASVGTVVTILVIPLIISWYSSVYAILDDLSFVGALFYGCLSMLFVLITLELSTLNSIRREGLALWKVLLIWACVWDVVSIFLLLGYIQPTAVSAAINASGAAANPPPDFTGLGIFVGGISFLAFIASFFVVLFAIGSERHGQ